MLFIRKLTLHACKKFQEIKMLLLYLQLPDFKFQELAWLYNWKYYPSKIILLWFADQI